MTYPQQPTAPANQSYYPNANNAYSAPPTAQPYYGGANAYGAGYPPQADYGPTPPQIKNPFAPPPSRTGGSLYGTNYDPEYEAQVQQWQSAYVNKEDVAAKASLGKSGKGEGSASAGGANAIPLGAVASRAQTSTPTTSTQAAPAADPAPDTSGKEKTVMRTGGGTKWEDPTLLEWGDHPRLFIGNLAGEVTDESLLKAFAKYPSVQKARVIRDKRTTKSKGFGFVSLANTDEFFQAAKEMNGKYIGSHPVLIKRAEAEIKAVVKKDDKRHGRNNKNNKNNKNKNKEDQDLLAANTGAGIQKKQSKAAGQYKVLSELSFFSIRQSLIVYRFWVECLWYQPLPREACAKVTALGLSENTCIPFLQS